MRQSVGKLLPPWTRIRVVLGALPIGSILAVFVLAAVPLLTWGRQSGEGSIQRFVAAEGTIFFGAVLGTLGAVFWCLATIVAAVCTPEPISSAKFREEWLEKNQKITDPALWRDNLGGRVQEWDRKDQANGFSRLCVVSLMTLALLYLSIASCLYIYHLGYIVIFDVLGTWLV